MNKALLSISLIFILASCSQVIEYEEFSGKQHVVLNSIISTDNIWNVSLSYTKSLSDPNPIQLITNAEVKIKDLGNDQVIYCDYTELGYYDYHLNPLEGHTYKIEVTTEAGTEVSAVTTVPEVLDVSTIIVDGIDDAGADIKTLEINIEDNPNSKDFYFWEVVPFTESSIIGERSDSGLEVDGEIIDPIYETIENNQIIFTEVSKDNTENQKSLFDPVFISDTEFDGNFSTTLIINGRDITQSNQETATNEGTPVNTPLFKLVVMAVSQELYDHMVSLEQYQGTDAPESSHSAFPLIYSNIQNGKGIFGAYSVKEFPIY